MNARVASFTSFYNVINGQRRASPSMTHGTDTPTRLPLWEVPLGTEDDDLNHAVAAAQKAFIDWSRTPWTIRQILLARLRQILLTTRMKWLGSS
jgi:acyl-CoA reductase-like NAD-dependent aldehyde dehydrogenase